MAKDQENQKKPRNRIIFGAPGTGKSHKLNLEQGMLLGNDASRCVRVTFHPDYSYANFVGTYKPKPDKKGEITYKYVPGPFITTYINAKCHPNNEYVLIIEEINRANVAAVFGDVFQLLDRTGTGVSEYPVKASKDLEKYLEGGEVDENGNKKWVLSAKDCKEIKIPSNMYIWSTMNSADQGVFPMDTAFKRRWDFEYLDIDNGECETKDVELGKTGQKMQWNVIRKIINKLLIDLGINEDKLLGFFFINEESRNNSAAFNETFKNKILMYLFEDAAKHKRKKLFNRENVRYSELCALFDDQGLGIFKHWEQARQDVEIEIKQKTAAKTGQEGKESVSPNINERAGE